MKKQYLNLHLIKRRVMVKNIRKRIIMVVVIIIMVIRYSYPMKISTLFFGIDTFHKF